MRKSESGKKVSVTSNRSCTIRDRLLKCLEYKDQYLKGAFVFATAIILCHPASRSVFSPPMT